MCCCVTEADRSGRVFLTPAFLPSVSSPRSACLSKMCVWSCESPLFRDLRALWASRPISYCSFCLSLHFFFFCCAVQLVGSQFPSQELNLGPGQCELAGLDGGGGSLVALLILISPGLFSPLLWLSFSLGLWSVSFAPAFPCDPPTPT